MDRRLDSFARVRLLMAWPLTPIQYIVNLPNQWMSQLSLLMQSREKLALENEHLKNDNLLLRFKLQRFDVIQSENIYLKALLKASQQIKKKVVIADILAIASQPFVNQVVLNKGYYDHVYHGQAVLDATGLMGQIIDVGPKTSRVLLINDPHSGVSVQNIRNGTRAIAMGESYTGQLKLMYVPKTADVRIGDRFITSGLGDRYPEGYPVGEVISLKLRPDEQFAKIVLKPIAHLNSSRQVLLIWNQHDA